LTTTAFRGGDQPLTCGFSRRKRSKHRHLFATLRESKRAQSEPSRKPTHTFTTDRRENPGAVWPRSTICIDIPAPVPAIFRCCTRGPIQTFTSCCRYSQGS
jgi:hypothetical protein